MTPLFVQCTGCGKFESAQHVSMGIAPPKGWIHVCVTGTKTEAVACGPRCAIHALETIYAEQLGAEMVELNRTVSS